MIATLAAVWLASFQASESASDQAFDARMRDSAAAAQALQGPLDGTWRVADTKGRTLYRLQITDAPHDAAPLSAAWSDPRTGALGGVAAISRAGHHLDIFWTPGGDGPSVRLTLRRDETGAWTGWESVGGARRRVGLSRH